MDLSNRSPQPAASADHTTVSGHHTGRRKQIFKKDDAIINRVITVVILAAVVILIIGLIGVVYSNKSIKDENTYINTSKLQAVFLNTGQVYFGNVKSLNKDYVVLSNIYYLQTSNSGSSTSSTTPSTNANSNVTLVKLGCELHRPYDQMVINRAQVTFWENLEPTGQVAKAVSTFQQQNPNGQQCTDQSTSSGNTSKQVQNAGNSNH